MCTIFLYSFHLTFIRNFFQLSISGFNCENCTVWYLNTTITVIEKRRIFEKKILWIQFLRVWNNNFAQKLFRKSRYRCSEKENYWGPLLARLLFRETPLVQIKNKKTWYHTKIVSCHLNKSIERKSICKNKKIFKCALCIAQKSQNVFGFTIEVLRGWLLM